MKHLEYVATSREGFVQQVVSGWVRNGYYFYVQGELAPEKDPLKLDDKFIFQYPILMSAGRRYSRKKRGVINVAYLRFEQYWIMLATRGRHEVDGEHRNWREIEGRNVKNCRAGQPIQIFGYSVSYVPGGYVLNRAKQCSEGTAERDYKHRVRVQISREAFRELKAKLVGNARKRSPEWFGEQFWHVPYEPYAPVRKQLLDLLRLVNSQRKSAGLSKISTDVIRYQQKKVKVFEAVS